MLWFFLKTIFLVIIVILIRGSLPRYRVDQLVNQHWKLMMFCLVCFVLYFIWLAYFFCFFSFEFEFRWLWEWIFVYWDFSKLQ